MSSGVQFSWAVGLVLAMSAGPGAAQTDLAQRVDGVRDGVVRFTFRARAGVCGDGRSVRFGDRHNAYWEPDCGHGPVHVVVTREAGRTVEIETFVGGRWRSGVPAEDFGRIGAIEASRYLLSLVQHALPGVSRAAIMPAQLADSVEHWPALLDVARNASLPDEVREAALFWVGQAASDKAVEGLEAVAGDERESMDLRERAVFALSQQRAADAVPALIRLAREHDDPRIRRRALFWLGQQDDPRVIALFEEILEGGQSH